MEGTVINLRVYKDERVDSPLQEVLVLVSYFPFIYGCYQGMGMNIRMVFLRYGGVGDAS